MDRDGSASLHRGLGDLVEQPTEWMQAECAIGGGSAGVGGGATEPRVAAAAASDGTCGSRHSEGCC